jgi:hypothetical protein
MFIMLFTMILESNSLILRKAVQLQFVLFYVSQPVGALFWELSFKQFLEAKSNKFFWIAAFALRTPLVSVIDSVPGLFELVSEIALPVMGMFAIYVLLVQKLPPLGIGYSYAKLLIWPYST